MSVFTDLNHIDRTLRELKVASHEVIRIDITPIFNDKMQVLLTVESLARVMGLLGSAVREKSLQYIDGCLHAGFKAKAIHWVACKPVDLPTFEKIQAVFGGRVAGIEAPARALALEGGAK